MTGACIPVLHEVKEEQNLSYHSEKLTVVSTPP